MGTRRVIVAVLASATLAGCGAADRAPDAEAVAERFHAALDDGDGEAACADLAEETQSKLEQQEEAPCEEAIVTLELPKGGEAAETRVYVTSASVTLAEGGTTFLDEAPEGWKVASAGCEPTAPELPYDCVLEG
jgi:hypothetical protein